MSENDESLNVREPMKCETNNFGCLNGWCWSNCGPRMKVSDCYTTIGKIENNISHNIEKFEYDKHNHRLGAMQTSVSTYV